MFNQFKLLLVIIPLGILGVLFFQNQELISLKILCGNIASEHCFYQTSDQPLAVWMAIFLIIGLISSLIWQLLQTIGLTNLNSKIIDRSPPQEKNYRKKVSVPSPKTNRQDNHKRSSNSTSDWEDSRQSDDWGSEDKSIPKADSKIEQDKKPKNSSFETEQKIQNKSQSGSTYSYQFKKSQNSKKSADNKNDEVYDASYRAINTSNSDKINNQNTDEDEEDWI